MQDMLVYIPKQSFNYYELSTDWNKKSEE